MLDGKDIETNEQQMTQETNTQESPVAKPEGEAEALTAEEMLAQATAQNQELMNELAKLRKASDKNASEAADWKKKYRSTLDAQTKASEEAAEKKAAEESRVASLERKVKIYEGTSKHLKMGWSAELAEKGATALADGDMDTYMELQSQATVQQIEAEKAKWLKSRPDINAGTGTDTDPFIAGFKSAMKY